MVDVGGTLTLLTRAEGPTTCSKIVGGLGFFVQQDITCSTASVQLGT